MTPQSSQHVTHQLITNTNALNAKVDSSAATLEGLTLNDDLKQHIDQQLADILCVHSPSRTLGTCHSKGLGRTFVVVIASLMSVSEAICNSMLVQTVATTGKQLLCGQLLCGAKWRHWRGRGPGDMIASEYATANGLDEPMPLISFGFNPLNTP
jgi:hypothetical protein